MILLLLLACAPEPLRVEAEAVDGGVAVQASAPLERVALLDDDGRPVAARSLPTPASEVRLLAPWEPGEDYVLEAESGRARARVPVQAPAVGAVRIEVAAPLGQGSRPVADRVAVTLLEGASVEAALVLDAVRPVEVTVHWGTTEVVPLRVAGERRVVRRTLSAAGEVPVAVEAGGERTSFVLDVTALSREEARQRLRLVDVRLPVDASGAPDRARPPGRVALPARWWSTLLRRAGLGWRPRDDQAPWGWQAVTLEADEDLAVAVSARVEGTRAFRSRIREAPGGPVSVLLQVPAGRRATAVLPFFVDRSEVEEGSFTRVVEVVPLGSSAPLYRVELPLHVTRGSPWASAGFGVALLASLLGLGWGVLRGGSWLREARTSELVTIALFGALTFVVAAAARVVGYGVASVLGPFAPLLTGLVDDAFRTCLLATLLVLIPRPGVLTLASLVGYLLRGLALGSFHPADLLYFGSVVFWLEGACWVTGLTRGASWRDGSRLARWARLSLGFGTANALAMACGLAVNVVLYRLFLADWYVAAMVGLPGFLYVVAGSWVAVGFAESLRRVEP